MANYKAVANGNWSALATWQDNSSGSFVASTVLPGAADVVYWNNFTVAINQNVTVLQIRNDSTTGVTAGGGGTVSTSRTINAELFHASGSLITISATSPSVVNINGNMPGTVAAHSSNGIGMHQRTHESSGRQHRRARFDSNASICIDADTCDESRL